MEHLPVLLFCILISAGWAELLEVWDCCEAGDSFPVSVLMWLSPEIACDSQSALLPLQVTAAARCHHGVLTLGSDPSHVYL